MLTLLMLLVIVPPLAAFAGWTCVAATAWYEVRNRYRRPPSGPGAARTRTPALR